MLGPSIHSGSSTVPQRCIGGGRGRLVVGASAQNLGRGQDDPLKGVGGFRVLGLGGLGGLGFKILGLGFRF